MIILTTREQLKALTGNIIGKKVEVTITDEKTTT